MFVAGWRHALRSEWPFIIIIIIRMELAERAMNRPIWVGIVDGAKLF